jgi:hypothetical protein
MKKNEMFTKSKGKCYVDDDFSVGGHFLGFYSYLRNMLTQINDVLFLQVVIFCTVWNKMIYIQLPLEFLHM